jgi:hypothetical protein
MTLELTSVIRMETPAEHNFHEYFSRILNCVSGVHVIRHDEMETAERGTRDV